MIESSRVYFDTSVIVPGLITGHQFHEDVAPYFEQAAEGRIQRVISGHAAAETFRWLSALHIEGAPPLSPQEAAQMCLRLRDASHLVAFDEDNYKNAIRRMAELDRSGPLIYDVLHGLAALKYECETLLTFDVDFYRLGPDIAGIVKIPGDG